jgi:hypothetical protein
VRWLVLLGILSGCDDLDSPVPDLAMPDLSASDLSVATPCTPPAGGFCVWGTINDFTTRQPRAGVHVAVYEPLAFLANPNAPLGQSDGPIYSMSVPGALSAAVLVVSGVGLAPSVMQFSPAPNDAFHIDPFAIPSSLATDGTLDLFFSDFSPSPIKQTLAAFQPVAGVTVSVSGIDGGTGAAYVGIDRATIDPGASSTTSAGAALLQIPSSATVDATGGTCTGPCSWPTQTAGYHPPGFVWVVPRYQ